MRFGLFLQPVHHTKEHPTVALERDLELVSHLDRLGYAEAWIGEHHSTGWENIAAPEVVIGVAAERTRQIRLGTGVVQLGLHHPLIALDRAILLDHLTRGRSMFGVGVGGGLPSDLKVFGLTPEESGLRLEQSLDVMERLLEGSGPVSERTDWFEIHEATLQLRPYSHPHMTFAVASTNPRNVERMGRLGGLVLAGPVPQKVPGMLDALRTGARTAGVEGTRGQIRLSYAMHLAEDREEAISEFREGAITEHYEFNVAVNGAPEPSGTPEDWYQAFVARNIIGSPEDAVAKLIEIEEASGGVGGILFTSRDWAGTEASFRSWELFARHVAPRFQSHVGAQTTAARAPARQDITQGGEHLGGG